MDKTGPSSETPSFSPQDRRPSGNYGPQNLQFTHFISHHFSKALNSLPNAANPSLKGPQGSPSTEDLPFTPSFHRPAPPTPLPVLFSADKPVWLDPLPPYYQLNTLEPLAPSGIVQTPPTKKNGDRDDQKAPADERGVSPDDDNEPNFNELVSRAISSPLSIRNQQAILTALKVSPSQVSTSPLNPTNFKDLVENNPLVAHSSMLHLLSTPSSSSYLSSLVSMDMSLHSMEVVNRLTLTVSLPREFIHLYIANCITSCTSITDRYLQSRLVRLVCVFLQSLLRNRIIKAEDLYIEVGAFCVEFSRIREAAGLFKLIKKREGANANSSTT